jgi:hypothetical protein
MPGIFIYQIEYSKSVTLDPGFLVLDNLANERPDWFEYWPIRKFLIEQALNDESFYGFVSPRFKAKTNLSAAAAREFVARESAHADAVVMSPGLKLGAYFQNVFTFGEYAHPGLLEVTKQFIRRIDPTADLDEWVTTSRNEVYCNYVIAKPRFWRAWLAVTEQLFAIAESPTDPLGSQLRATTLYRDGQNPHMKIFILERLATWILATNPDFVVKTRDPFVTSSRAYKLPGAILCDALKIAYLSTNHNQVYLDLFRLISTIRKPLGWLIRFACFLRFEAVRAYLMTLSSKWTNAEQP